MISSGSHPIWFQTPPTRRPCSLAVASHRHQQIPQSGPSPPSIPMMVGGPDDQAPPLFLVVLSTWPALARPWAPVPCLPFHQVELWWTSRLRALWGGAIMSMGSYGLQAQVPRGEVLSQRVPVWHHSTKGKLCCFVLWESPGLLSAVFSALHEAVVQKMHQRTKKKKDQKRQLMK